ncbi:hypothetical protein HBB16_01980, partial [Pseudonocardia sp. MCCB 268]|nr:hypothetical protein [Pseudonocardia cytotoxica]
MSKGDRGRAAEPASRCSPGARPCPSTVGRCCAATGDYRRHRAGRPDRGQRICWAWSAGSSTPGRSGRPVPHPLVAVWPPPPRTGTTGASLTVLPERFDTVFAPRSRRRGPDRARGAVVIPSVVVCLTLAIRKLERSTP